MYKEYVEIMVVDVQVINVVKLEGCWVVVIGMIVMCVFESVVIVYGMVLEYVVEIDLFIMFGY